MAPTQSVFQPVDTVLTDMMTQLQSLASRITDFNTGSVARTTYEGVAIVVSNVTAVADQLQEDSYLDTATGSALDALGANNWFVPRNPAVQAAGQITITRQATTGALTLPAGWSQLATSPSVPGDTGIAVVTTQDADFAIGVASVTVNAQAVIGGLAGNLSSGTFLTPMAPVNGISSQNGFEVTTAFTGGVDVETDDAYRIRIPITVQGRVKGRKTSFLAAALGVPGVLSAGVLGAGDTRGDSSVVPVNTIEVYYQGSAGLLAAVQSAADNASTWNQDPTAYASISLSSPRGQQRVVATLTVYMLAGGDPVGLAVAVAAALQVYVTGAGIGNTVYAGLAAEAVLAVPDVVSVDLPFTQFSLFGGSGAADIPIAGDSYANLALSDVLVTVDTLP